MANVNNRLVVVVAGSLGVLGGAWLGGVAVASGGNVPVWAAPVAIGAVAVAGAVAWLASKVSHGGDWADGAPRAPRSRHRNGASDSGAEATAPEYLTAGFRA
jgi:hypothetical protein